jgi:hypothetical protein
MRSISTLYAESEDRSESILPPGGQPAWLCHETPLDHLSGLLVAHSPGKIGDRDVSRIHQ